jgi:glycosyltransferase involved in cell wall biosynthesis
LTSQTQESPQTVSPPADQAAAHPAKPLSLVFYDVNDPLDKTLWAGTAAHIIHSFQRAGHQVRVVGKHIPFVRRCFLWLWYHYYLWVEKKYYHPDRDVFWTRIYSKIGSFKLSHLRGVDAVVTCSPAFTAYLETPHPVFLLHDSTWGQIVETYPHFARTNQPARIVDGGFKLDQVAFNKPGLHAVMTSRWAADRAIADYGAPPEKFSILPFGANFSPDPPLSTVEAGMAAREERFGQPDRTCQLLFVGRDWKRKGGPLAVAITEHLRKLGIPAVLHIIGCSPPDLPEFVKAYGLLSKDDPDHMQFLKKMYAESDFFLMPTRAEAQGIVFNESAAYGLPVVSTDVGGVSTVVQPDWGFLLPPETGPEEYASWIKQTFLNRTKYQAFSQRAREDYEQRLSSAVYVERLSQLIQEKSVQLVKEKIAARK